MENDLLTAWQELSDTFDGLRYQLSQKNVNHSEALLHAKAVAHDIQLFIEGLKKDGRTPRT